MEHASALIRSPGNCRTTNRTCLLVLSSFLVHRDQETVLGKWSRESNVSFYLILWFSVKKKRVLASFDRCFFVLWRTCFTEFWNGDLWLARSLFPFTIVSEMAFHGVVDFCCFFMYSLAPPFTEFYWGLPSGTGFYHFLLGFTNFYWVLPSFTGFYLVVLGFTEFYLVLLGFTYFYWDLPSFTGFYLVLLSFIEFYWVLSSLLGFTEFTGVYLVFLGFTEFYWVLPSFT